MSRLSRLTSPKPIGRRRSLHEVLEARCLLDAAPSVELSLVSNQPNTALVADPSVGAGGGFSVSDSHVGHSNADGKAATTAGTIDVRTATLSATALAVQSQGLAVNNAAVATVVDTGGADPLTNYSATIDWGDGSSASAGTITPGYGPLVALPSNAYFNVAGSHTYAATGEYTFTVTIDDSDGSTASVHGTVDVSAAKLDAKALPVVSPNLSVGNATVAVFHDTGGEDPVGNYTATIDWGDGSSASAGTITAGSGVGGTGTGTATPMIAAIDLGDYFSVAGSHVYTAAGHYTFTVVIDDSDGTSTTVTGTAEVSQATLVAKGLTVSGTALTVDQATVAGFIDTGGSDPLTNYTATIDWGDGSSPTIGTISGGSTIPGGPPTGAPPALTGAYFSIAGSHTYTSRGDYTTTITIGDRDGTSATVKGAVDLSAATLEAQAVPVVSHGLIVDSAAVADFVDTGGADPLSNYSATIEWGDNSTSAGTIKEVVANPPGGPLTSVGNGILTGLTFEVSGSHTYAASGDYEFTVSIADSDGTTATATAHAYVDAPAASYVANAFEGLLHRSVDDSGLSYWNQQIAGGVAPAQFASDLTHSAEFYATNVIDPDYQAYLGRSADSAGIAYWTSLMQQGLTDQQIEANFIASDEFYAKAGGTDSAWVNAMYQTVLGRPADQTGLSYWLSQLSSGVSRSGVATSFATSQEHEGQIIQQDYFTYLGRSASPDETSYWVAQFDEGATNEDIVSGFVGSAEYLKLHS